jgi:hypothetical protein
MKKKRKTIQKSLKEEEEVEEEVEVGQVDIALHLLFHRTHTFEGALSFHRVT